MSRRALILGGVAGGLLSRGALGGSSAGHPPRADDRDAVPGPFQLAAAHVVVGPDLIRGVLRVHNPGPRAWAVADRWNSWGAHLWTFQVAGRLARNPVDTWDENRYTETVLASRETRALRFSIAPCLFSAPLGEAGPDWFFTLSRPSWETALPAPPPFVPGTRVDLRWEERERRRPDLAQVPAEAPAAARAAGLCRALSKRLDSIQELLPWLEDGAGHRLPSLP